MIQAVAVNVRPKRRQAAALQEVDRRSYACIRQVSLVLMTRSDSHQDVYLWTIALGSTRLHLPLSLITIVKEHGQPKGDQYQPGR